MNSLRLAITADLHWGLQAPGDAATRRLVDFLKSQRPDLFILAGDIGTQHHFAECLALFDDLPAAKALTPGNHDVWVEANDRRGDSMTLYEKHLPELAQAHGFHYLDAAPLLLASADLAVVGSINWYDYSWSLERLQATVPDWEYRVRNKLFSRGRHNDFNFVRWGITDGQFTDKVVSQFRAHLQRTLSQVRHAIAVTHHPCFYGLNFPRKEPLSMDGLLWDAFSGNRAMEELLLEHQDRIPLAFSGHTHRARESQLGGIRGYNLGGDYDFKRLLLIDWPAGDVAAHEFRM